MDINSAWNLFKIRNFQTFLWCHDSCFQSNLPRLPWIISTPYPETHPGKGNSKISKNQQNQQIARTAHSPAAPGQPPRDPGNYQQHQISIRFQLPPPHSSTKSASAPVSTTRQQHQININFLFPPPDSSTKSASASSFHHQAAVPHQPASSKASSQSAVNSTTLPHPHHGSQVCCCLDILWLYSAFVF